jgi:hypothetical protein
VEAYRFEVDRLMRWITPQGRLAPSCFTRESLDRAQGNLAKLAAQSGFNARANPTGCML